MDKVVTTIKDAGNNNYSQRLLVSTPTTGLVRMEWVGARYSQVIPTNWSKTDVIQFMSSYVPLRFTVHDAQNVAVKTCIEQNFEWLLFIEHDTMPPMDAFLQFTKYMDKGSVPVVSGLYFTRSIPPEPLIYRGRGNHYYRNWKLGDMVWADGVPTGMLLIHARLLRAIYDDSPEYIVPSTRQVARRVFDAPAQAWFNEITGAQETLVGTSDLVFCTRIIKGNYLAKAGWPKIAKRKYPFLVDTNILCKHINTDGTQFPVEMPAEYIPPKGYKPKRAAI